MHAFKGINFIFKAIFETLWNKFVLKVRVC